MKLRALAAATAVMATLAVPASAHAGHFLFDHPFPSFSAGAPLSTAVNSGGPGASWELVTSFPTGNPHTDIDFFRQDGDLFVSAGTLAIGPNGGGQTIFRLTDDGALDPAFVSGHPSASCLSNPSAALSLQHDVEATPKGGTILNANNPYAVQKDAEVLIDSSDAEGRCHDQGLLGLQQAPQGGIEIIDVTDPAQPKEIGLVSNIGEAHTVNVDPKRPHIVYAVTSDSVNINADGSRANENPTSSQRFNLDGFEVIDISSCMGFAPGTSVQAKRDACRPEVWRYRYPTVEMALGHTLKSHVYACHELEVYPTDLLTCGSGDTLIALDMSDAFDDNGTPEDFSDDTVRGDPLSCRVRGSSSLAAFTTGAMVTDCVDGTGPGTDDLTIPPWLAAGAPSIQGVSYLGSIYHQGRGAGGTLSAYNSKEDIDFDHEAELSQSGDLLLATDERGGGVAPPGATCSPGVDNDIGNGGIHAYRFDGLSKTHPATAEEAFQAYARTPTGEKAIYRAEIHTPPEASICTAHVFQQIPGQNRIFMGWYSQGTQVVDFVENPDGTVEFTPAGYFIPENANTWVSAVFDYEKNPDGTYTYWGATGDFNIGAGGRSAVDIWKATLPAPPEPAPLTIDDCKRGGWEHLTDEDGQPFSNQGDCVSHAASASHSQSGSKGKPKKKRKKRKR